ncbi:lecithin-cholesterol acyltransferase [Klebsormidium nitens]|uniref:Lecithin-cholesterol acyltransferase n=1 Tax=Klebsormidium nitens TaxID=105231 RepID=A0A1Y1HPV8_KLENI|nr:lecithin-cholesterol acyltransferase [Klebsormidium nitens]|eukprot:GAQ78646.1 lecithin-cholesterol acyltransferase [Klebsormidium nitens]
MARFEHLAVFVTALLGLLQVQQVAAGAWKDSMLHPVIIFPGFSYSRLRITVNATFAAPDIPDCRASTPTTFDFFYGFDPATIPFSEECIFRMLEPIYTNSSGALSNRFSPQPGVQVSLPYHGTTLCLGALPNGTTEWDSLISQFKARGLRDGETLRVACYDWRASPNVDLIPDQPLIPLVKSMIEDAYEKQNGTRVFLIGHSNGPVYAQHFLNQMDTAWKEKYVQGLIAYAGNWPGQGYFYSYFLAGLTIQPEYMGLNPATARSMATFPSTYSFAANPAIFTDENDIEIVRTSVRSYRVSDAKQLLIDAGYGTKELEFYDLFNGAVTPNEWPGVNVHEFFGTNLKTEVGTVYSVPASIGLESSGSLTRLGDMNQEDIVNDSTLELWQKAAAKAENCRFSATELDRVNHFQYLSQRTVIGITVRLMTVKRDVESVCEPGDDFNALLDQ